MSFVPVGIPGSLIINAQAGSDKPGLKCVRPQNMPVLHSMHPIIYKLARVAGQTK